MVDEPKSFVGMMVSSTFTDLKEHRQEVIDAIAKLGFHPVVMEHSGANASDDVIATSLAMVRDCSAYVLLISHKYGQTPSDSGRNPNDLSITELEFNEAVRLGRPRLLFIMGDDHPVKVADVETDPLKIAKRDAFKERAKAMCPATDGIPVNCIYEVFNSKDQLAKSAAIAIGKHAVWLATKNKDQSQSGAIDPAEFAKLIEAVQGDAAYKNVSTEAVLALAGRVAENVPDLTAAIGELHGAIDDYLRIRENAAQGTNFSGEIDQAINRVVAKIEANEFDAALAQGEIEYLALETRESEIAAAKLRLVRINMDAARVAYDAGAMTKWIVERIKIENNSDTISSQDIFDEHQIWYAESKKFGSQFSLEVAISLAKYTDFSKFDDFSYAINLNSLGIYLESKGERLGGEAGFQLLAEAVATFRRSLEFFVKEKWPDQFAMVQNNLGVALQTQGEWQQNELSIELLNQAISAYRSTLKVYNKKDKPENWAMIQNNIGTTFTIIAKRQGNDRVKAIESLRQSIKSINYALSIYSYEDSPEDWAMAKSNLGIAYQTKVEMKIYDKAKCIRLLGMAASAYRAALTVFNRPDQKVSWAVVQNNLGTALTERGGLQGGKVGARILEQGISAYRAAIEFRTKEEYPLKWALTKENIGLALQILSDIQFSKRIELLTEARSEVAASLEVFTPDHMPHNWEKATNALALIDALIAKHGNKGGAA